MNQITNKEIHDLIMELGCKLSDFDFYWPDELKNKFNKITKHLE